MTVDPSAAGRELAAALDGWAGDRDLRSAAAASIRSEVHERGETWRELAEHGWLGAGVSAANGGSGGGLLRAAVVAESLGGWCGPGAHLPTAIVAISLDRWGAEPSMASSLCRGAMAAGLTLSWGLAARPDRGGLRVSGRLHRVWAGLGSGRVLAPVEVRGQRRWVVLDSHRLELVEVPSVDGTRRLADAHLDGLHLDESHLLDHAADPDLVTAVLGAAEAVGLAARAAAGLADLGDGGDGAHPSPARRAAERAAVAGAVVGRAVEHVDEAEPGAAGRRSDRLAAAAAALVAPRAAAEAAADWVAAGPPPASEAEARRVLARAVALRALLGAPSTWRERLLGAAIPREAAPPPGLAGIVEGETGSRGPGRPGGSGPPEVPEGGDAEPVGVGALVALAARHHLLDDPVARDRIAAAVLDEHVASALRERAMPEAAVRLAGHAARRRIELAVELLGADAAAPSPPDEAWVAAALRPSPSRRVAAFGAEGPELAG